jgi:predicted signal transduction protein with EAL and GGDEF domain
MATAGARCLSVSVGVVHGIRDSAEELIADADIATGVAKRTGKNRIVVFEPGMQTASQDRLKLEMDLAGALERGELFLMYQPTLDLRSERTIGAEALLRWRHPARGLIPPDTFIPIAEDSGLILAIGRWVLEQACHQVERRAAGWRSACNGPIRVSSSRHLDVTVL